MTTPSKPVTVDEIGSVGLIRIDNPPVNALSREVRAGLIDAITRTVKSPHLKIVLITSSGDLFSAGADLKEFDSGLGEPTLQGVQAALENAPIPVVAAIQGMALGGGLELAMACHYRIAHKNARLGLPEINLGIIPGAGGTQRLPRLIGARPALDMILAGTPISAPDAKAKGLIDEVADGDLRQQALNFCKSLVERESGPRPTRSRTVTSGLDESSITEAVRAHARTLKGRTTQHLVVDAIKAASLPFAEGIAVEAALARQSLASRESMALRHIFFAERESGKVAGAPKRGEQLEIRNVAVLGAGTMGSGIAIAFADAGRRVTLIDNAEAALVRSREIIQSTYASNIKRGRLTQEMADERTKRVVTLDRARGPLTRIS